MSPELPEKLLGIDIDDPSEERRRNATATDEAEELARFVFFTLGDLRLAVPVDAVKTIVDPPALTTVPRSSTAIDGITDLRGEITAVIDTRTHFPVGEPPSDPRLIVFDRPTDEQSAAITVDDVLGVETVPVRDVFANADDIEEPIDETAFDHPLVAGLIRQEQRQGTQISEVIGSNDSRGPPSGDEDRTLEGVGTGALSDHPLRGDDADPIGEEFTDGIEDDDADTGATEREEIVVETTALVDVERLLLASKRTD